MPLYFLEFDPKTKQLNMTVASTEFNGANAVEKNADGSEIYIGDGNGKKIGIFKRDKLTNKLTKLEIIDSIHGVDNLKFDKKK